MLFSNLLLSTVASAAVIGLPLKARNLADATPEIRAHLESRADHTHHGSMKIDGVFYMADVEIGNPAQTVGVAFDTGSPLLWVPGSNSTDCLADKCYSGYNVTKSSSWKYQKQGKNWGGEGMWGTDSVSYAGASLDDFNVYVSDTSLVNKGNSYGVFGQSGSDNPKGSFVQGLAASGQISRPVYSVNSEYYINGNLEATQGTVSNVYYGGFDKKKYQGPLTTLNTTGKGAYGIPLTGLLVNGKKIEGEHDHHVVLDTGGIKFDVTNNTLGAVVRANGGFWETKRGWHLKCDSKPTLTYQFGYTKLDLDMTVYMTEDVGNGMCLFQGLRVVPDDKSTLLTGPALISRALVIYDNERNQITVGKAKYTKESEVVEITGDIPGAHSYQDFLDVPFSHIQPCFNSITHGYPVEPPWETYEATRRMQRGEEAYCVAIIKKGEHKEYYVNWQGVNPFWVSSFRDAEFNRQELKDILARSVAPSEQVPVIVKQ